MIGDGDYHPPDCTCQGHRIRWRLESADMPEAAAIINDEIARTQQRCAAISGQLGTRNLANDQVAPRGR
jgi:hypothetical protein